MTETSSGGRPTRRWRYVLVLALSIAAATIGAAVLYRSSAENTKKSADASDSSAPDKSSDNEKEIELNEDAQKKMGVEFGTAKRTPLHKLIRAPGSVSFDERNVTHLRARTQGRVIRVDVQPGDQIKAGQTLAALDSNNVLEARRALDTARATLNDAIAAQTLAQTALERATYLVTYRATTPADVEKRQADVAKALAAVQSAQAQLDASTAQYQRLAPISGEASGSAIISPIDGVVTSASITLGEVIDTNQDAFTVADPSRMLVQASLYASDIDLVKSGDEVTVMASQQMLKGRIRSVNVALDAATNTAAARIELLNPELFLRANMFVTVLIIAELRRNGITIPASAVQITEQGQVAFVRIAPTKFERRDLQLGLQQADWVEVQKGIEEGETVATKGSFNLKAILLRSLLGSTN